MKYSSLYDFVLENRLKLIFKANLRKICLLITGILTINYAISQDTAESQEFITKTPNLNFVDIGTGFFTPLGDFKRKLARNAIGFEIGYLRQINNSRIFLGGVFESRKYDQHTVVEFDFDLDQKTVSSNMTLMGLARIYPEIPIQFFDIFIEGGVGLNYHYAYTNFYDKIAEESFNQYNNLRDYKLVFFAAPGVQFPVNEVLFITFRSKHFFGPSVDFLSEIDNPFSVDYSEDAFELKQAAFRARTFSLSLSFLF
jgi:hypothetical protein